MSRAHEIEDRAALWVLRREEPSWSLGDQQELDSWLAESDAHKAAFWRLEHGWREADRIASIGVPPKARLTRSHREPWRRMAAAAASVLLVFAISFLVLAQGPNLPVQTARFETGVGGHKLVSLSDGTRVELNTATVIKAAVDEAGRTIWLERGEAFFDVAKDRGRQFVIYAGPRKITVLGTKFSVTRDGDEVTVAVLEGRVLVEDSSAEQAARSATIAAGDMAIAEGRSMLVAASSTEEVEERLAWRSGMLLFDETTLADAAAQFNRYNRKQLVVEDPETARTRIGGSFQARNVDAFARLLREAYGLDVEVGSEKISISS